MSSTTIYKFSAKRADGSTVRLSDYQGKVLLVVNVASHCGYTPQYDGLEALYKMYSNSGLVVLGFPCDQFGKQEPGSNSEIQEFCRVNYGVTFPVFAKIKVNTLAAHPLYAWLKSSLPESKGAVKWNFEKFLVGRDGRLVKRFKSAVEPAELEADIAALL